MPLPAAEAPQGIYGYTVQPLEAGEVWVQDVELGYLSGQVGLGAGWDATVGGLATWAGTIARAPAAAHARHATTSRTISQP